MKTRSLGLVVSSQVGHQAGSREGWWLQAGPDPGQAEPTLLLFPLFPASLVAGKGSSGRFKRPVSVALRSSVALQSGSCTVGHSAYQPAAMRRRSYDDATAPLPSFLRSVARRRQSAPSVVFGKALALSWTSVREEAMYPVAVEQCAFVLGLVGEDAKLLLDDTAQVTEGLKTRERHLFLLTDVLAIAKFKSSASYRLKHRVNLEDLWVCGFKSEDDGENEDDLEKTILLAWSKSLCLVSFSLPEVKERWLNTLQRKITEARESTVANSPPPTVLMKVLTNTTTTKIGGGMDSVIEQPIQDNSKVPAPTMELCKQELQAEQPIEHESSTVGRRSIFSFKLKRSSTHSGLTTLSRKCELFGQPLSGDTTLPKPIAEILDLLWRKGPSTEGVFRKPCNKKNLTALREQLDTGAEVEMEALPVVLLVGLLKMFLNKLPGSLLVTEHYGEWVDAVEKGDKTEKLGEMRRMADKLPKANNLLLQNLLCLLHHISKRSQTNKMDAKNLAVCIAPTLLQQRGEQALDVSTVEKVTSITQFLIENCCELFGEKILTLLGDPKDEELGENSDSMPSNQHDSAYDSPDPEGDGEGGEAVMEEEGDGTLAISPIRIEYSHVPSCSSEAIFETYNNPFDRRSSEPTIFPSVPMSNLRGLARSHDDCSTRRNEYEGHPLKKQNSDNTLLTPQQCERNQNVGARLSVSAPVSKMGSCSSSCSLESAASNVSENSPFVSSPLPSPTSSRKNQPARHASTIAKSRTDAPKMFKRARSLGSFSISRAGSKKGEAQKDAAFPCGTLLEDMPSEVDVPGDSSRRQRPLSAIEVFQHVDSLNSRPPSYEQALLSGVLPLPPQHQPMTVGVAREMGRKSRPVSMNENILDTCSVHQHTNTVIPSTAGSVAPELVPFRQRAMSESVACSRMKKVSQRCSQPVFEEFPYAKESYV